MVNEWRIIKWGRIAQSRVYNRGNGDRNNKWSKIITEMQGMKLKIWSKNEVEMHYRKSKWEERMIIVVELHEHMGCKPMRSQRHKCVPKYEQVS